MPAVGAIFSATMPAPSSSRFPKPADDLPLYWDMLDFLQVPTMWLEDLSRDLRHAVRTLRRDRGFAATAVVALALGIGLTMAIFSLTAEFLFQQPSLRDASRMVEVQVGGAMQIPIREYRFLEDAKVFEGLAGASPMQEVNWRADNT